MINVDIEVRDALKTILPTHHELMLHGGLAMPCISYSEDNNITDVNGDTIGYSTVSYIVKVWAERVSDIVAYSMQVDDAMRRLGFKRSSSREIFDNASSRICKIMVYSALAREIF